MTDVREQIMVRLLVVVASVEGIVTAKRNVETQNEVSFPAVSVREGDEPEPPIEDQHGKPTTTHRRIVMTPQVIVHTAAKPESVGTDLNTLRARIIKAVLSDATLAGYTFNRRSIFYLGLVSDLAYGRDMIGRVALKFAFTYILDPNEL